MTEERSRRARPRVLVVADDADVRLAVRVHLEFEGFDVVGEAGDGAEAIRLARELRPDVVVLELEVPVIAGLEAIPAIRREAPHARIVVLSSPEGREVALLRGGHAYLSKPFDPEALVHELEAVLLKP